MAGTLDCPSSSVCRLRRSSARALHLGCWMMRFCWWNVGCGCDSRGRLRVGSGFSWNARTAAVGKSSSPCAHSGTVSTRTRSPQRRLNRKKWTPEQWAQTDWERESVRRSLSIHCLEDKTSIVEIVPSDILVQIMKIACFSLISNQAQSI